MVNKHEGLRPEENLVAPRKNFVRGLYGVEIPDLGLKTEGKVRDNWRYAGDRVMVTTDRQSAFDKVICTVPGKGKVLNLLSAFWFEKTSDIIGNHVIKIPHPNVLIAREAGLTLPVEIIVRDYMAKSSTTTSVYHNYFNLGRREIYGVKFPDGLKANEKFSMGPIITPTTKAKDGEHDLELTQEDAKQLLDSRLGNGVWEEVKRVALAVFQRGSEYSRKKGLILADTKMEFGLDGNTDLMLIDELITPDSSRFWLAKTYQDKFEQDIDPQGFDKEILRRWLASVKFTGTENIPVVPTEIIDQMAEAYKVPYEMVVGVDASEQDIFPYSQQMSIKTAIKNYFRGDNRDFELV